MEESNRGIKSKLSGWFKRDKDTSRNTELDQQKNRPSEVDDKHELLVYSGFAGNSIANTGENNSENIKQNALTYLQEKKNKHAGLAYIEQLDKNYVYLDRCVLALADHYNMFLLGQENAPKNDAVDETLNQIRLSVRDESDAHMRYLVFGCNGCHYHADHVLYKSLRELRLRDMDAYVDEIEFGTYFFKAAQVLSQYCLRILWDARNQHFANSFHSDRNKMKSIFYKYVRHTTTCILNDMPLRNDKGELLNYIVLDE